MKIGFIGLGNVGSKLANSLLRNKFNLTGMDLGTKRTLEDYESYAGFNFKEQWVQQHTLDNKEPHNPEVNEENPWKMKNEEWRNKNEEWIMNNEKWLTYKWKMKNDM